jgi:hypothetical protein
VSVNHLRLVRTDDRYRSNDIRNKGVIIESNGSSVSLNAYPESVLLKRRPEDINPNSTLTLSTAPLLNP